GGGDVIIVDPRHVDVGRFERLASAGHAALGNGGPAAPASHFPDALGLWPRPAPAEVSDIVKPGLGSPRLGAWPDTALGGRSDIETLAVESTRLEELQLTAIEGRIEADIAVGRHAQVTGELERLVAEHPVRERLWRLLVLALYRDERQADALAAYRRARTMLT